MTTPGLERMTMDYPVPARRPGGQRSADLRRYNSGQKRDPDGKWGDGIPGPSASGLADDFIDELNLADRIDLPEGATLGTTGKVGDGSLDEEDAIDLNYAVIHYRGEDVHPADRTSNLRLAIMPSDESDGWNGEIGEHGTAYLNPGEVAELHTGLTSGIKEADLAARQADKAWNSGTAPTDPMLLGAEPVASGGDAENALGWQIFLTDDDPTSWQLRMTTDPAADGIALEPKNAKYLLKQVGLLDEEMRGPDSQASRSRSIRTTQETRAGRDEHTFEDGICLSCADDEPDGPLDEHAQALLAAISELGTASRAFDPADHPRNPKGSPGGGKFRSNVDKLKDALAKHKGGSGEGDAFEGFDREQLRRVAKARGIELQRGEGRESIAAKLKAHLGEGEKPAPKVEVPKPEVPKPEPKKRAPRKRAPAKKAAPEKPAEVKPPAAAKPGTATPKYDGPTFTYSSEKKRKIADELVTLKAAEMSSDFDYDRTIRISELEDEAHFTEAEHNRVYQLAQISANTERWRKAKAPEMSEAELHADMERRSREAVAGKPIAVRVTPGALSDILDAGRFKSQFETHRSNGLLDTDRRAGMEKRWFGLAERSDPAKRPIYGYVAVDGIRSGPGGDGALDQYGGIQVVLKDDVKSRTTATWGDSLNIPDYTIPEPLDNLTWRSYSMPTGGIGNAELKKLDRDVNSPEWREHNYVEAQIHGGVAASDIAEVVLDKAPDKNLRAMLDEAGISWRVS